MKGFTLPGRCAIARQLRPLLILIALFTLPGMTAAQSVTGEMQGVVVAEDGSPLPSAAVAISAAGVRERIVITDAAGSFRLLGLPPGAYVVNIDHIGRAPVRLQGQPVRIGQTSDLGKILMTANPVGVEGFTITARPVIDPLSAAHGSHLSRDAFEHLPLERDYVTITTLLPHTALSPLGDGVNVGGATGLENQFYVDGVNASDPILGVPGASLPYQFVKEIQVRTGGYEAEFRGALGGIINAVTQSGQNALHVETFAFFSGQQFSSAVHPALFDRKRTDYSQYDFGAAVGGAIKRDRLWYFVSYNPTLEREDVAVNGLGILSARTVAHRYAGKLSWQPDPRTRIVLTSVGDPSTGSDVGNTGGVVFSGPVTRFTDRNALQSSTSSGATTLSLRASHVRGEKYLWEGWIDRSDFREKVRPRAGAADEPYYVDETDPTSRTVSGGLPVLLDNRSTRTSAALRFMWVAGAHTLKLGLDVSAAEAETNQLEEAITRYSNGYERYSAQFFGTVRSRTTGLFLQDSWRIGPRLRFNPGVRLNAERFYGTDGKLAMRMEDEWQPRIALLFQPGTIGRHKLSASWGRFYEDVLLTASSAYHAYGSYMRGDWFEQDPRTASAVGAREWAFEPGPGPVLELSGLYYDEYTIGYERVLHERLKATVRLIRRDLGEGIEDVGTPDGTWVLGNPGRDELAFAPRAEREYTALEVSAEGTAGKTARLIASYVLSRNYGNYPGWYNSDFGYVFPNANGSFDDPEFERNNAGLLPNDRTHVLKLAGSFVPPIRGLTLGTFVLWQSGTPIGELGRKAGRHVFIGGRGALGRTPSLLDVNARVSYRVPLAGLQRGTPTILVDVFHIGNKQSPAAFDQVHYRDEARTEVNPTYMMATQYHPPMSMRVGMQMTF